MKITMTLNGDRREVEIEPRETLFHLLRRMGILSVKFGSEDGDRVRLFFFVLSPREQPAAHLQVLANKGSLYITRPTMVTYTLSPAELQQSTDDFFGKVLGGAVRIEIGQTYALEDAARAHRDLEARRTIGSTVLIP